MDATTVNYQQCIDTSVDLFKSGMDAVGVLGPPGCGKTTMAVYIQRLLGYKARFIIKPGHHDVVDFGGVPVPMHDSETTKFFPSMDLLPPAAFEGGVLVVIDELPDAMVPNQNLMCQWIFEKGMHGYKFPENTKFFITGNRVADRAGASRLVTKIGNRMAMLTLEPTTDEWVQHGYRNGFNPSVLAFIGKMGNVPINPNDKPKEGRPVPTYFNSFDPTDPTQQITPLFASSRSLEFVSNLINYIDSEKRDMAEGLLVTRVAALTGTPWAMKYVPWRAESLSMPDPDAILRGDKVPFPDKESVLWTLSLMLTSKATKGTWKYLNNYMKQGPAEYRMLCIRTAFDHHAAKLVGADFNSTMQEPDVKQMMASR